ncbi:MAG: hypothetical protein FJY53_06435 [Betaproteobacteria bacterium]|nr:hypothetical protein [Betaproteobacteria bacterium]
MVNPILGIKRPLQSYLLWLITAFAVYVFRAPLVYEYALYAHILLAHPLQRFCKVPHLVWMMFRVAT